MSNFFNKRNNLLLLGFFSIAWSFIILIDYLGNHPYLSKALVEIPYLKTLIGVSILPLIGTVYLFKSEKKTDKESSINLELRGVWMFFTVFLLSIIILISYLGLTPIPPLTNLQRVVDFSIIGIRELGSFFLIILTAHALGAFFLNPLRTVVSKSFDIISIAVGFSLIGFISVILGLFGALTSVIMWGVLAVSLIIGGKHTLKFLKTLFVKKHKIKINNWWHIPIFFLILTIAAVNLIGFIKPFPRGYDGSYLYMNLSRLVGESNALPEGGQAFNWSVIMSLGKILFNSETLSIILSHGISILIPFVVFRISRLWLKPAYALLAVGIPYVAPYFGFHSIFDEKVDLAFLFISSVSLLLILEYVVNLRKKDKQLDSQLSLFNGQLKVNKSTLVWGYAGWLCGFAFGIKYTAIILVIALCSIPFYQTGRRKAYAGYLFGALGLLFLLGIYKFGYIDISGSEAILIGGFLSLLGAGLLYFAYQNEISELLKPLLLVVAVLIPLFVSYSPWLVKHYSENGRLGVQDLIQGDHSGPAIQIKKKYKKRSTSSLFEKRKEHRQFGQKRNNQRKEKRLNNKNPEVVLSSFFQDAGFNNPKLEDSNSDQGANEEVKRYLGYEKGLWLYTSLPYDLTMNLNIPDLRYLDISFLFLLLLPLLFFSLKGTVKQFSLNTALGLSIFIWLGSCLYSKFLQHNPGGGSDSILIAQSENFLKHPGGNESILFALNKMIISPLANMASSFSSLYQIGDHLPFSIVLLILLGISILLYRLFSSKLSYLSTGFKSFLGFLFAFLLIWGLLGNGIIWYAFPFWVLLPILLVYYFQYPEKLYGPDYTNYLKPFFGVIFGLYFLLNGLLYFTNPNYNGASKSLFSWQFVDFASNTKTDKSKAIKLFNPSFPKAIEALNSNKEDNIYRINTYLGYHIDENDKRVYSDNVLERFDDISKQIADDHYFIDVLRDNGFKYILYDLSTPVIDQTIEKSLQDKANRLIKLLISSEKVELVVSDNYVLDTDAPLVILPNGQRVNAKQGIVGKVAYLGSYVLYKIL